MIFNKTLNSMRKGDFTKSNNRHDYNYMNMEVTIERDFLNERWTYSSNTHEVSGGFYGSVADLKKHIKDEYQKAIYTKGWK